MGEQDIGWAIRKMRDGGRVTRSGWNGPGQFLEMQLPDPARKMTLPYIYSERQGLPWLASQTDLLATDWYEAS